LVFVVAWASDVMAFVVGSLLKGPKLWPRYSPNKTWSGFIGGLVAGALAGWVIAAFIPGGLGVPDPIWGLALGLAGASATMAGDLWESALKRRFGVKDAGGLIPGHGGLLDRVDGLMFAAVVLAGCRLLTMSLAVP
jgi:phosphatidate cytidylyltransferase